MQTPIIIVGAAGRMGSTVTRLARENAALLLVGRVEQTARMGDLAPVENCIDAENLESVLSACPQAGRKVIIDFTTPSYSLAVAQTAVKYGVAQVVGTTGLTEKEQSELKSCAAKTPIFRSPNMSVGVNVLLAILPELVRLLGDGYDMEMLEIHHNKKKDAPSGTAWRLVEAMADARGWASRDVSVCNREGLTGERPRKEIGVQSLRGGDVVGIHTAYFLGAGERIEITHQAHSRDNFAQGALRAAEWLVKQKPGKLYTMEDMLKHKGELQ
ncbi:4-hydroxy-tetrahydrodipicolinate reductase [Deltaproteobacteria bacterium]|nr:4-hydroxy-tetrahydrodipicolinate reductase [Deltaproteobacteria bacterium]